MTGADATRFAARGSLAATIVAAPIDPIDRTEAESEAERWIAAMVRLGLLLERNHH